MYRLVSLVCFLCGVLEGFASPVTSSQALRIASDFYASHWNVMPSGKARVQSVPSFTLAYVRHPQKMKAASATSRDAACYYVVNVGSGEGFIIVSGDDAARQVLAYGKQGTFDASHVSPALSGWLKGYEQEMLSLMSSDAKDEKSVQQDFSYPTMVVQPFIATKWDQIAPYNQDCPVITEDGASTQALVGCTATALAQIMKYYEWPARPMGFIDYKDNYAVRTMNFDDQAPFDWSHMLDVYGTDYSEEEARAVSHLSACAAYACKMYFSKSYSGSYPIDAAVALSKYFGYDANTYYYDSRFHEKAEWYQIVMDELEARRPILYTGFNDNGGHTFVCDGYDGEGFFHFNWGWSGLADGYFSLSALNPTQQGSGSTDGSYTFKQSMVCHIQLPGTSASVPQEKKVYVCSDAKLSYTPDGNDGESVEGQRIVTPRGRDVGVDFWFDRESTAEFYVSMVLGYMDGGELHPLSEVYNAKCTPNPNSYYAGVRTLKTAGLAEGTYHVGWYFREYGSDKAWERMKAANGNADEILLTVGDDQQTVSVVEKNFHLSLAAEVKPLPLYADDWKYIPLHIKNDGEVRLEGVVGFRVQQVGSDDVDYVSALAYCNPGETVTVPVKVSFEGATKGQEYLLTPVYCAYNNIYYCLNDQDVITLSEPQTVTISDSPMLNAWAPNGTDYFLDGEKKTIDIMVQQESKFRPWAGRIYAKILKVVGDDEEDTGIEAWSDNLDMPTRQTITTQLHVDHLEGLSSDEEYRLMVYINDGYGSDCNGTCLHEGPLTLEKMPTALELPTMTEGTVNLYRADGTCVLMGVDNLQSLQDCHLTPGLYILKTKTSTSVSSKKIMIK